jgi:hypothetical protein
MGRSAVTAYRCIYQTTNGAYSTDIQVLEEDTDIKEFVNLLATRVLEADYVTLGEGSKSRTILVKSHIVAVLVKEVGDDMSLRKFGTGDGEVTEVEETGEGIAKEAAAPRPWTPRDEAELEQESQEGLHGGELPPTP